MSTFTYSALLLSLFLTISTLVNCVDNSPPTSGLDLFALFIRNDLPEDALPLEILATFQTSKFQIKSGNEYKTLLRNTNQSCRFLYGGTSDPIKRASLLVYDPNGGDKGHKNVFWSVRMDGFYHSWDKTNWAKKADWGSSLAKNVRTIDEP